MVIDAGVCIGDLKTGGVIERYEKSKTYEINHVLKQRIRIETGMRIGELKNVEVDIKRYEKSKIYEIDHVSKQSIGIETIVYVGELVV